VNTTIKQMDLKTSPHSFEAEQSVLGGLMLDPQKLDDVAPLVSKSDFYSKIHQTIFEAIQDLITTSVHIDLVLVQERLEVTGKLDLIGGFAYLVELCRVIPSAANIESYAKLVHERAVTRELIALGNQLVEDGYSSNGQTPTEIAGKYLDKIDAVLQSGSSDKKYLSMKDMLEGAVNRIEENQNRGTSITGLSSGFADLDRMTSGFQKSDLIIIAARPSMGKTAFSMNIADYAAQKSEYPAMVFSLEMPESQIMDRLLSSNSLVPLNKIRQGMISENEWGMLSHGVSHLFESKMIIDDDSGLTPVELRSRAKRAYRENGGLSVIVVDYLQLMRVPELSGNRTLEIAEISRSLKALAKELQVPVIALSQLNRGLEQRSDKRPINSDLRESGAIEQDADLIMFIYRDEVYHDDSPDKGIAEIIIGKQRNGPIGKVRLTYQGDITKFCNYAGPGYRDEY